MLKLHVRKIGNSLGILLPKEVALHLQAEEGTPLYLLKSQDGVQLTQYDPEFARQLAIAREGMHRYRNALRELAKS